MSLWLCPPAINAHFHLCLMHTHNGIGTILSFAWSSAPVTFTLQHSGYLAQIWTISTDPTRTISACWTLTDPQLPLTVNYIDRNEAAAIQGLRKLYIAEVCSVIGLPWQWLALQMAKFIKLWRRGGATWGHRGTLAPCRGWRAPVSGNLGVFVGDRQIKKWRHFNVL